MFLGCLLFSGTNQSAQTCIIQDLLEMIAYRDGVFHFQHLGQGHLDQYSRTSSATSWLISFLASRGFISKILARSLK